MWIINIPISTLVTVFSETIVRPHIRHLLFLLIFPPSSGCNIPLFSFHPLVNSIFRSVPIHWCRLSSWRKRVAISPFMPFFRRLFWNITVLRCFFLPFFCGILVILYELRKISVFVDLYNRNFKAMSKIFGSTGVNEFVDPV